MLKDIQPDRLTEHQQEDSQGATKDNDNKTDVNNNEIVSDDQEKLKSPFAVTSDNPPANSFKNKLSISWEGKIFHSLTDSKHSRVVSILIDKKYNCKIKETKPDDDGRIILINIIINNSEFDIYSPTKSYKTYDNL